jgi:hypothetical protein
VTWLACFSLTVLVELVVVRWVMAEHRLRLDRWAARVVLANLITHPAAYSWLAHTESLSAKLAVFLLCELLLIPVAEALVYARSSRLTLREALGVSYIANAASLVIGFLASAVSA